MNARRSRITTQCTGPGLALLGKLLDALGVQADSTFNDLDPTLRQALTVGRPVAERPEPGRSAAP